MTSAFTQRALCGSILMAVLLGAASAWAEAFYLKSSKTGRMYGPFDYRDGGALKIGDASFEIVRSPEPEPAAPVATAEPVAAKTDAEREALAASTPWLAMVDSDAYDDAWRTAAPYLRAALTREEFAKSLTAVRKTLGHVKSRELSSIQYTQTLPSAPDGEYVVIHYRAVLERKKDAVETIVPMLQDDGTWRISGYYLR